MSAEDAIISMNRAHPDWDDQRIADEIGCTRQYVRIVAHRHKLTRPPVPRIHTPAHRITVDTGPEIKGWLNDEAKRMGPGIKPNDVVLAILRDAMAGE